MNTETDNHLLLRWQRQRDARAFREIANRHMAMVFATCRRVLRDATEAEDLTQECFLQLAQYTRRPPDSLPAWLHVVAVRRSTSRLRSLGRRASREQRYAETQPAALEPGVNEVLVEVDEALAELPETLRAPLVLGFLEQRGQAEIAAELGISQSTVSRRIERGIAELRSRLAKREVVVTAGALVTALHAGTEATVPAAVVGGLGKLALGGRNGVAGATGGITGKLAEITGGIFMKKIWAAAVGIGIVALGIGIAVNKQSAPPPAETGAPVTFSEEMDTVEATPAAESTAPVVVAGEPLLEAEETSGTEAGGIVEGHALDAETGDGIAGVHITATWYPDGRSGRDDKQTSSASTGADGAYRITGLALEPGKKYELSRDTPDGYRRPTHLEKVTVVLDDAGQVDDVDFLLRPEVPVGGVVVDTHGRPVGGAEVHLGGGRDFFTGDATQTDDSGRFAFHGMPPAHEISVSARHGEGRASEPYTFSLPESGVTDIELVLAATGSVSGTVVDGDGKGLEGFTVRCMRTPHAWTDGRVTGASGEKGRFEIAEIPSGNYELVVVRSDRAGSGAKQKGYPVTLAPGEELEGVTLVFGEEFVIAGRITNMDGEALEGVRVRAGSSQHGGGRVKSDPSGNFRVEGLQAGGYQLEVGPSEGYQHMRLRGIPAGTEDLEVVLPPPFSVSGQVVEAKSGQPIPQFEIAMSTNWTDSMNSWMAKQFETVANDEGRFELQQSQLYRSMLAVRAPGYATAVKSLELTGPPYEHIVEMRLEKGSALKGNVVDTAGSPIAGANIYWGRIGVSTRAATQTGADGTFELPSFPSAPQLVSVDHPDYAPTWLNVDGASQIHPVEIVLTEGAVIEGMVTFSDGAAVLSCKAAVTYPEHHYIPDMMTDVGADGTFRIDRIKPGETTVTLTTGTDLPWPEHRVAAQTIPLQAGYTTEVTFLVEEFDGAMEGVVRPPDGALVSQVLLTLEREVQGGTVRRKMLASPDGTFHFGGLPPGQAEIRIDAGFQNLRRIETVVSVEIPEGATGYVEIPLDAVDTGR